MRDFGIPFRWRHRPCAIVGIVITNIIAERPITVCNVKRDDMNGFGSLVIPFPAICYRRQSSERENMNDRFTHQLWWLRDADYSVCRHSISHKHTKFGLTVSARESLENFYLVRASSVYHVLCHLRMESLLMRDRNRVRCVYIGCQHDLIDCTYTKCRACIWSRWKW